MPAHAGDDDENDVDAHHHAPSLRHVSAFVGGTSVAGHTSLAIGAEAEYRLPMWKQRIGLGALVDAALGTYLMRSGIGYDVHVQSMSISPMLNFDFVDGHVATVFGIAFGVGF